jgi:NAD(P)-dependent dehydrogenase (short-subunit alcohol dehydrogenase family)
MSKDPRVALVTGGNRGLGLETSWQLAEKGLKVFLAARNLEKGREAVAPLHAEGLDITLVQLDVTDPDSVVRLADRLRTESDRLDILVNNAGVAFDDVDAHIARQTLEANYFGVVRVTDTILPLLTQPARIVMVSSGLGQLSCLSAGRRRYFLDENLTRAALDNLMRGFIDDVGRGRHGPKGWPASAYRVSKVGVNAFTRIVARELLETGILVNAVCPGWVKTDMGGTDAPRPVEDGARSIVWAALLPDGGPTGGFFRDGRPIPW